jgi:Cu(I)/Ag(I) efflux system membrane fusion protein
VQARIEIANPNGRLKAGMYAVVHLQGAAQEGLLIPAESVIRTGKRAIVMLAGDGGRFQPVEVTVGRESNGRIEVLAGLSEGQKVVASGQFLIDSEASLAGLTVKPLAGAPAAAPAAQTVEGHGVIEALKGDEITLSHDAIPALGWPAMTMSFALSPSAIGKGFKAGDHVRFTLEQTPQGPVVRRLERMESVR